MTQEEKYLLLKDLCARLPHRVMVKSVGENKSIGLWDLRDIYNLPTPYLRPMSSMTEEEKDAFVQLQDRVIYNPNGPVTVDVDTYIDWLNAHHFDHRGLIEKGLALEAPEGMY